MTSFRATQRSAGDQRGLTLIEMLVVMGITSILLTLGAFAVRHFWLLQSLNGAQDELISQMRQRQEQAVSESHPLVFGVRLLPPSGTDPGSSQWGLIEYKPDDPSTPANELSCIEVGTRQFSSGVVVQAAAIGASPEATYCAANATYPGGGAVTQAAQSVFVFFYPRGTATGGTITLRQPALGREVGITVRPITGRSEPT